MPASNKDLYTSISGRVRILLKELVARAYNWVDMVGSSVSAVWLSHKQILEVSSTGVSQISDG